MRVRASAQPHQTSQVAGLGPRRQATRGGYVERGHLHVRQLHRRGDVGLVRLGLRGHEDLDVTVLHVAVVQELHGSLGEKLRQLHKLQRHKQVQE